MNVDQQQCHYGVDVSPDEGALVGLLVLLVLLVLLSAFVVVASFSDVSVFSDLSVESLDLSFPESVFASGFAAPPLLRKSVTYQPERFN